MNEDAVKYHCQFSKLYFSIIRQKIKATPKELLCKEGATQPPERFFGVRRNITSHEGNVLAGEIHLALVRAEVFVVKKLRSVDFVKWNERSALSTLCRLARFLVSHANPLLFS